MSDFEEKSKELHEYIYILVHRFMILQCGCLSNPAGNLSLQELKVIDFLGRHGPSIMRKIADHLMLAVSTMTGIVDKLVQKELAIRETPEEDRRIVRVELTDKGQQICQMNLDTYMELSRGMLEALNEDEQEILLVLLRKIIRNNQMENMTAAA